MFKNINKRMVGNTDTHAFVLNLQQCLKDILSENQCHSSHGQKVLHCYLSMNMYIYLYTHTYGRKHSLRGDKLLYLFTGQCV